MKKITKILLVLLIIILAFTSLVSIASATYVPVITPACITYLPTVYNVIHEAFTGEKSLLVVSQSMAPTIEEGAIVYYKSVKYEQLKAGDIIVCDHPLGTQEMPILRRIISINSAGLTTKGDGNNFVDAWIVTRSMFIGIITDIKNPSGNINFHPNTNGTTITNDNLPPSDITARYNGNGQIELSALINGNQYSGSITANLSVTMQQTETNMNFSVTLTPTNASESISPLISTNGADIPLNFAGTVSGSQVTANAKGTINGASFDINLNGAIDSDTFAFTLTSDSNADIKLSTAQQIVTNT